ncbi:MAG TPA: formate dehydrogenase accessory protein FdhE [Vicinamibacterales bacterium]|nr:formate dehydrogenase accessory protein FdhE [Vicinamibacterales bacterium]
MRDSWDDRIRRARALAAIDSASTSLLEFYGALLVAQQTAYENLRQEREAPAGSLERDLPKLHAGTTAILKTVAQSGPPPLASDARALLDGEPEAVETLLLRWWHTPADDEFFAKASLQPYAQWLAGRGIRPIDRALPHADSPCPFCGGAPQVSILDAAADSAPGGRLLQCGTCLTSWPVRRVLCPYCAEEDEHRLAYYHAPEFDHLRVDVCESCRHYVKTVDLTRLGIAVPLVDEVAGAPLDIWAREQGYRKIQLNLVGL